MSEALIDKYFPFFLGFTWIWIAVVTVASFFIRRSRGKAIFAHSPDGCVFEENRTSGRELGGIRALGDAANALKVCVTSDTLFIMPHFPFTLLFLPEIWGLYHAIRLRDVRRIEETSGFLGSCLIVHLSDDRRIELRLRNPDGFKRAIAAG